MASNAQAARALSDANQDDDYCTRRKHERVFCADQNVRLSIRLRGEMRSHRAELLDISAFGAAVSLTRPLTAERTAFLSLSWGQHRIKDVVCTISNCLQTSKTNALLTGYRCGLSFRPSSPLQLDRQETVSKLNELTAALSAAATVESAIQVGEASATNPARAERQDKRLRSSGSELLPPTQPAV